MTFFAALRTSSDEVRLDAGFRSICHNSFKTADSGNVLCCLITSSDSVVGRTYHNKNSGNHIHPITAKASSILKNNPSHSSWLDLESSNLKRFVTINILSMVA